MKNIISLCFFLLLSCCGFSQGWERFYTFGLANAMELPDGDYLVLAGEYPLPASILRTDEAGNEKWRRELPVLSTMLYSYLFPLPSGNIALITHTREIIEIDTAAHLVSSNPIAHSFRVHQQVFQVADGLMAVYPSGPDTLQFSKINFSGQLVWEKEEVINDLGNEVPAIASPDGGFLLASGEWGRIRLIKFDADGQLQWINICEVPNTSSRDLQLIATADGGYFTVAEYSSGIRITRFDETGNRLWEGVSTLPPPADQVSTIFEAAAETADGGVIITGCYGNSRDRGMIVKFNNAGAIDFSHLSLYEGRFTQVLQTSDGGYYALGGISLPNPEPYTPWGYAIKIDVAGTLFSSFLKGHIALDENQDCLLSPTEFPLRDWIVRATGAHTYYGITDATGGYFIGVDSGAYVLEVFPPSHLWSPCDNQVPVTVSQQGTTVTTDFSAQTNFECPAIQVDIAALNFRRCFNSLLIVEYCNLGTAVAEGASIEVTLDSLLLLEESTIPFTAQTGNTYTFPVGDLDIGACGSFQILALTNCDAELEQALCIEAHAFPDTICGMFFNWSGASMVARASCQGDTLVALELENVGTVPTSEALDYSVIEDQIIFLQGSKVFQPAQIETILQPANGSTWSISSEQEPNHPGNSLPTAFVEGCGINNMNTFSTGFVNEHPQADGDGFLDIDCLEVIGSFDPNDKAALPVGYGDAHNIEPGTDLEYRIRFQNTGTDTAFTVVIRDTLSLHLDPTTLRPGAASHPYTFSMEGNAVAIFRFHNIMLPDSNVNEALSHGFVSFSIAQKPEVPLLSVIENEAAIYFDFNEPVITNRVFHTVNRNFIEVNPDVDIKPDGLGELLAYPNPSCGNVTFEIPTKQPVKATFVLYNPVGRKIAQQEFAAQQFTFQGNSLPPGIYFYTVEVERLGRYSGKLILNDGR